MKKDTQKVQLEPFDIRNFTDRLTPKKEKNRYKCPTEYGGTLSIDPKSGKYKCWGGCFNKDVREAIRPLEEALREAGISDIGKRIVVPNINSLVKPKLKPVSLPEDEIILAQFPQEPEPVQSTRKGNTKETIYYYSSDQWVVRTDYYNEYGDRTHKKVTPWHKTADGKDINRKGDKLFPLYRNLEVKQFGADKWVLSGEGEKVVEAARSLWLVCITWIGSDWHDNAIANGLIYLNKCSLSGLIHLGDNDPVGRKKSENIVNVAAKLQFPCLIINPLEIWEKMPDKGDICDWIAAHPDWSRKQFIEKLNQVIRLTAKRFSKNLADETLETFESTDDRLNFTITAWCEAQFSDLIAEKYRNYLAWDSHSKKWLRYGVKYDGIWGEETKNSINLTIDTEINPYKYKFRDRQGNPHILSQKFTSGVESKLQARLEVKFWNESKYLIPFLNGVLNPKTLQLNSHCPENRFMWCLPYMYDRSATCDPIIDWFNFQIGDTGTINVLRAYLYAIITGKYEWQQYLEIIGRGGTGKGTFTRMAMVLVGLRNTHSTKLQKLEKSNFESASLKGKRLCIITDSERFAGEVSMLKALTGSDMVPHELKFQQSTPGFIFEGMVLVAANEPIISDDYTSGLQRRRITVKFDKQIDNKEQRVLLDFRDNGEFFGEFAQYIPGLLNWVLSIGEDHAKELIKNHCAASSLLIEQKATMLTNINPLAAWSDEKLILEPGVKSYIGIAKEIRHSITDENRQSKSWNTYENLDSWLYANYVQFCKHTGMKEISLKRFSSLLLDLLQSQLKLAVFQGKDRKGSYIKGIRIRTHEDKNPSLFTFCDEGDESVMGDVTVENHALQDCDGCDGKNYKNSFLL